MSAYVLRYVAESKVSGWQPVAPDTRPMYLYKSARRDPRGRMRWQITDDLSRARIWATREGAEGYWNKNLRYPRLASDGIDSRFAVEEVTP